MHWFNALALNDTYTTLKNTDSISFMQAFLKNKNFSAFDRLEAKISAATYLWSVQKVQESLGHIWHYIEGSARRSSIQVARELSKHLDATRGFEFPTSSIRIPAVAFWVARRMQVFFQSDSTRIWFPLNLRAMFTLFTFPIFPIPVLASGYCWKPGTSPFYGPPKIERNLDSDSDGR